MSNSNRSKLFEFITASSFVMDDLRLFLDTHPTDKSALDYFQKVQDVRNQAVMDYTNCYGPINSYNVAPSNDWSWGDEPWPWEGACK